MACGWRLFSIDHIASDYSGLSPGVPYFCCVARPGLRRACCGRKGCQVRFPIACLSTAASYDRTLVLMRCETTDYRPSILKGRSPDSLLFESRELEFDLSLNALCVPGYQISILPGSISDGFTIDARLDANLSGSISECLLLDGRKLRSNHSLDTLCISRKHHWMANCMLTTHRPPIPVEIALNL